MKFCDKLTRLRKQNNLSQEQLAEMMGVSRQAVSKWESGQTYPDMDKMLQLCKILDCKLNELLDDGVIDEKTNTNNKSKNYLNKFLDSVTKIYNMFCSMTSKEKTRCIFEVFFISILMLIMGSIVYSIIKNVTYRLLDIIPYNIGNYFYQILIVIYSIILLVLGVIIVYHLFKSRYLDYYDLTEDKGTIKNNEVEKPSIKSTEKIVIRDPKDATYSFTNILIKIIKIFIKGFLIVCLFPIICMFIATLFVSFISIYHISYGMLFISSMFLSLSIAIIGYIFIELIFNFIFNRKQHFKRLFIMFISSLLAIGLSIGGISISLLNYKFVDNNIDIKLETKTLYLDIKDNTSLCLVKNENIEYIIDDNIEKAKIDITTIKDLSYKLQHYKEYSDRGKMYDSVYLNLEGTAVNDIYNLILTDLKNKKIRDYTDDNLFSAKVYLSNKDYNILKNNHSCFENDDYDDFDDEYND